MPERDQNIAYEAAGPERRVFEPWHLPRKHYVRVEQWCTTINRVRSESGIRQELRYFGLPGKDLLDLRVIASQVCSPNNLRLVALGLNEALQGDDGIILNASEFQLESESTATSIHLLPDSFHALAAKNSQTIRKFREFRFFHVVNLDFCDGVAAGNPAQRPNNYEAIKALLDNQCANANCDWILFLTTRVGAGHCHEDSIKVFQELIEDNQSDCPEFADEWNRLIDAEVSSSLALEKSVNAIGILKWLAAQVDSRPDWSLLLTDVCTYCVNPDEGEDLCSLAIRFIHEPAKTPDKTGLIQGDSTTGTSECRFAVRAVKKMGRRKNVDQMLANDLVLQDRMVQEKATLLHEAGYEREAYVAWVSANASLATT